MSGIVGGRINQHTVSVIPYESTRKIIWTLEDPEFDYIWGVLSVDIRPEEDPFEAAYNLMLRNGMWADSLKITGQSVIVSYQEAKESPGSMRKMTSIRAAIYSHNDANKSVRSEAGILRARTLSEYLEHYGKANDTVIAMSEILK